jgi:hypothetical protein
MLNDDAFARLVAEDVKNRVSSDQSDYLRLPENQERWRKTLAALIENLNEQIEGIKRQESEEINSIKKMKLGKTAEQVSIVESEAGFEERRKKISRFRFHVENKLAEADRLIALGEDGLSGDMKLANLLTKAINTHREMMFEFDIEPTPLDTALWRVLEGKWEFLDIDPADLP